MDITLIKAIKGDEVHGTDNEKKTGCGINLTKPENFSRYIKAGTMNDLKEISCEKCKDVLAKKIIKADKKEMSKLIKEEKAKAKRGIVDENIVPLGGTQAKMTGVSTANAERIAKEKADSKPIPAPTPVAAKPIEEPKAPQPAPVKKVASVGIPIDDSLAAFIVKPPVEDPVAAQIEAEREKPLSAPTPAAIIDDADIISQFAIPVPKPKEKDEVEQPHTPKNIVSDIDAAFAQFAIPAHKAPIEDTVEVKEEKKIVSNVDDILAQFAIPTPANNTQTNQETENQPEPIEKLEESYDEDADVLAQFAIPTPTDNAQLNQESENQPEPMEYAEEANDDDADFLAQFAIDKNDIDTKNQDDYNADKASNENEDFLKAFSIPVNENVEVIGEEVETSSYNDDDFVDMEEVSDDEATSEETEENDVEVPEVAEEEAPIVDTNAFELVANQLFSEFDMSSEAAPSEEAPIEEEIPATEESVSSEDETEEQNDSLEETTEAVSEENIEEPVAENEPETIEEAPPVESETEMESSPLEPEKNIYHYAPPVFADEIPHQENAPMDELEIPNAVSEDEEVKISPVTHNAIDEIPDINFNEQVEENVQDAPQEQKLYQYAPPVFADELPKQEENTMDDMDLFDKIDDIPIAEENEQNEVAFDELNVQPEQTAPIANAPQFGGIEQSTMQNNFMQQAAPQPMAQPQMQQQFMQMPQFMGYDQNGQPIYAYVQPQIIGYDPNGQPIFAPVQMPIPNAGVPPMPTPMFNATQPMTTPVQPVTPVQPIAPVTPIAAPVQPVAPVTPIAVPVQPVAPVTPIAVPVQPVAAPVQTEYTQPKPFSPEEIHLSKIDDIKNKQLPNAVAAAVSKSKDKQKSNIFDMQDIAMPVIDSIEDALSQMGADDGSKKNSRDIATPQFEEYKAPPKQRSYGNATSSKPAAPEKPAEPAKPLSKEEIKRLKKQEKIDAKFKKDLAKRGF